MAGETERAHKVLRELGKLLKSMPAKPAPADVHKLRTTARRVEAIANALQPGAENSRDLLKPLAHLRKAAGGVRDMDVLTANARKLVPHFSGDSMAFLLEHLGSRRAKNATKLRHALVRDAEAVSSEMKHFARRLRAPAPEADSATAENPFLLAARRTAHQLGTWPALSEHNIHEFRLELKQLRYLLQFLDRADDDFVVALSRVQRRIGEWHDWQQLREIAGNIIDPAKDRELLHGIGKVVQEKLCRALAAAKELRRRSLRGPITRILGC